MKMILKQRYANKAVDYLVEHRDKLLLLFVVLLLGASIGVESLRAWHYHNQLRSFHESARAQQAYDAVDSLHRYADANGAVTYCEIYFENITVQADRGLETSAAMLESVHTKVQLIHPIPTFDSLLVRLPYIQQAVDQSDQIEQAATTLSSLLLSDPHQTYCSKLGYELNQLDFLIAMQKPEAISALSVGQLEDYQVKMKASIERIATLEFPNDFRSNHEAILSVIGQLSAHLRDDQLSYEAFSRNIESGLSDLQKTLDDLYAASPHRNRLKDIVIQSDQLLIQ